MKSTKAENIAPGGKSQYTITSDMDPLGRRLRDFFSAIEDEGIPDRFLDLLDKLDAAEDASCKIKTTIHGVKNGS